MIFDLLPIDTNDFTMKELTDSIELCKNNKSPGLDEIPAEVWKTNCLNDELLTICNKPFHGDAPQIWRKGGIVPFPKKRGFRTNIKLQGHHTVLSSGKNLQPYAPAQSEKTP